MIPPCLGALPPKYCFKENYGKIFSRKFIDGLHIKEKKSHFRFCDFRDSRVKIRTEKISFEFIISIGTF